MSCHHKINLNKVSYRRDYKKQSSIDIINRFHLRIIQSRQSLFDIQVPKTNLHESHDS